MFPRDVDVIKQMLDGNSLDFYLEDDMFEIELRNPDEMSIKLKDRAININVAQSAVSARFTIPAP